MKKAPRILGIICLMIAVLLVITAIYGHTISSSDTDNSYSAALAKQNQIASHQTSSSKTAPATIKKAATAQKSAQTALDDAQSCRDSAISILTAYTSGSSDDILVRAITDAVTGLDGNSEETINDIRAKLSESADSYVLELIRSEYDTACKSLADAESKLDAAISGIASVYSGSGIDAEPSAAVKFSRQTITSFEDVTPAFEALIAAAENVAAQSDSTVAEADAAQAKASEISAADSLTVSERLLLFVGNTPIGFTFTSFLFFVIGLILTFCFDSFIKAWHTAPLFSTLIALAVMTVIQIYALGFAFDSYDAWGLSWLKNLLNVLRSNSSNGMIALGMTFVIITGGIDLSVGSNLAGVATVIMVILDVSANGRITAMGLTGWPNYIVAIIAGLVSGACLGALIGLGVTKGRIPPFIFTLGVMEITRSVAQYFTRSFKTEVPKAFQVIANQEIIGGQMLLPIIYWLVLAIIMYVISRHTAFGKHIYAVGSNERTSRLSGINVDRVKIAVYTLMGVIVAIAAITQVARLRGVDVASAGSGYEMNAIAAVVVGGTSMSGGRGSILGTVFGVLIIGIMNNLLVLLGIDAFLSDAFTGAIIIFAVLIQRKDK